MKMFDKEQEKRIFALMKETFIECMKLDDKDFCEITSQMLHSNKENKVVYDLMLRFTKIMSDSRTERSKSEPRESEEVVAND